MEVLRFWVFRYTAHRRFKHVLGEGSPLSALLSERRRRTMEGDQHPPAPLSMDSKKSNASSVIPDDFMLLLPLCVVSFIDAISFMVVAPSLIFYVRGTLGGTKETYGLILSIFSLSSFLFKPILGYCCDHFGGKFRWPHLVSLGVAALGGILYFCASNVGSQSHGILLLFTGRFLGGAGSANSTLGFTYVAKVVHADDMTKANALLSMMRVVGMTLAPASFAMMAKVPDETFLFGRIHLDPLNSVGLLLFLSNATAFLVVYFFLEEPPKERTKAVKAERDASIGSIDIDMITSTSHWEFVKECLCFEILLFVFGILCLNSNFQLLETSLAPVSNHALGWGPVQVSSLFGANAVFLLGIIVWTFHLSSSGVSDFDLLSAGLAASVISYVLLYLWWTDGAPMWQFVTPVFLSTGAFPFLGAPTRSLYTKIVASKQRLRSHQGTMQAVLSMAASVSGFMAPGLIATFVLRTPHQIDASPHGRELTEWALLAPLTSFGVLLGVLYLRQHPVFQERDDGSIRGLLPDDASYTKELSERTSLVEGEGFFPLPHSFEPTVEAHRRESSLLMGIPQIDTCLDSPTRSVRHHPLL